jgi:hypothetical protein
MASGHPDKAETSSNNATQLNEARRVLQNPALRLRHLAELEFPGIPVPSQHVQDWDFFMRTGEAAREAAALAGKKSQLASALALAAIQADLARCRTRLGDLQEEIAQRLETLAARIKSLPEKIDDPATMLLLAEDWIFLKRVEKTIREAILSLD